MMPLRQAKEQTDRMYVEFREAAPQAILDSSDLLPEVWHYSPNITKWGYFIRKMNIQQLVPGDSS